jgi:threonine/homoserine efflux transporter RhtA
MNDLADKLFGTLPKEYCSLFYYFSVLGFVWLVIAFLLFISMAVSKPRNMSFYISAILALVGYGVFYLQNRLLHTMCAHSL